AGCQARQGEQIQKFLIAEPAMDFYRLPVNLRDDALPAPYGQKRQGRKDAHELEQNRDHDCSTALSPSCSQAYQTDSGAQIRITGIRLHSMTKMPTKTANMRAMGTIPVAALRAERTPISRDRPIAAAAIPAMT